MKWFETIKTKSGDITREKHITIPTNRFTLRWEKMLGISLFSRKNEKRVSTNDLRQEVIWYLKDSAKHKVTIKNDDLFPEAYEQTLLKIWGSGGIPKIVLCPDSETKKAIEKVHKEPKYYVDDDLIDEVLVFDSDYLDIYKYGKTKDKNNYGIIHTFPNTIGLIKIR